MANFFSLFLLILRICNLLGYDRPDGVAIIEFEKLKCRNPVQRSFLRRSSPIVGWLGVVWHRIYPHIRIKLREGSSYCMWAPLNLNDLDQICLGFFCVPPESVTPPGLIEDRLHKYVCFSYPDERSGGRGMYSGLNRGWHCATDNQNLLKVRLENCTLVECCLLLAGFPSTRRTWIGRFFGRGS